MSSRYLALSLTVASALMAACGGGTNSTAPGGVSSDLVLEGAAATGAAMPNAGISVKCATGTGAATTAADGTFKVTIPGGALPCAVRAISLDAKTVFHSAIEGSGAGNVVVNVTPMSELIVAQAHGTNAATLFDQFDANKVKLTALGMADAKSKVKVALSSIVDLTGTDPIKDKLIAAVGTAAGNDLDRKLDTLRDKLLAAELKIQDLTSLLAANTGGSLGEIVKVIVQPPNAGCKAFRSGRYRIIEPAGTNSVTEVDFDATTLKSTNAIETLQMTAEGCLLRGPGFAVVIGSQGAGALRTNSGTLGAVIPKQNLALTDMAGTWNWVQRSKASGSATSYSVLWGELVIAADGKSTSGKTCDSTTCKDMLLAELPVFAASTDGGFAAQDGLRMYGFRAATGALGMVGIDKVGGDAGKILIARKGPVSEIPELNAVLKRYDLGVSASNVVDSAFSNWSYSVTAVDATANTFTRRRASDCRVDTLILGKPFAQMFEREASTSPGCFAGSVIQVSAVKGLVVKGLGIGAYVLPGNGYFGVTVVHD